MSVDASGANASAAMMPADKRRRQGAPTAAGKRERERTFQTVPALLRWRGMQPGALARPVDIEDLYSVLEPAV